MNKMCMGMPMKKVNVDNVDIVHREVVIGMMKIVQ